MKFKRELFSVSQLSDSSIRIINVEDEKLKKEIIENSIEALNENKTPLVIVGNDNVEIIRNNSSYTLYSAGIITERILSLCKKNNICFSLSMGFNEANVRKLINLPMFMNIISIITIDDKVEIDYEFLYKDKWEPRD